MDLSGRVPHCSTLNPLSALFFLPQARVAHSAAEGEELRVRGELEGQEARLRQLYLKQGRSQTFATQKDRDVFLKQEVWKCGISVDQVQRMV